MAHKKGLAAAVASKKKPVPVTIVHDPAPMNQTPKKNEYDKWRAEDDLRALQRAAEIQKDKTRMSHVKKCANEQMKALKNIK